MRYAFALLSIALFGCAYGVVDEIDAHEEEEQAPRTAPKITRDDESSGNTLPCNRREVVTFVVNGRTITFAVPTLCDPEPYIEKGDPPPWRTRNPYTPTSP